MEPTKKTKSFLELIVLEPESEFLSGSLGITDERNDVLVEKVKWVADQCNNRNILNITDALHTLSLEAKHANELALMVFHYGRMLGRSESEKMGSFESFLNAMLKKGGNPFDQENDNSSDNE